MDQCQYRSYRTFLHQGSGIMGDFRCRLNQQQYGFYLTIQTVDQYCCKDKYSYGHKSQDGYT